MGGSVSYLLAAENPDGGFGPARGQPSAELYSGWAALGLAAAGYDLQRVTGASGSLLAYVRAGAGSLSDVGSLERTILVVRAAGLSARSVAGRNLIAELERRVRSNGSVSGLVNLTSFAVLALRAAGVAPPSRTIDWLERQQDGDGGFSFATAGGSSDVDDTGAVLEALAGQSGPARRVRSGAVAYLRRQQNRDGGFPSQSGETSNSQSTAWAIQGLDAVHVRPASLRRGRSATPLSFLRSMTAADGSVRYARGVQQTPVWVTAQALMALAGKPLPLAPAAHSGRTPATAAATTPTATTPTTTPPTAPTATARSARPPVGSAANPTTAARPGRTGPARTLHSPSPSPSPSPSAGGRSRSSAVASLVSGAGLATALVLAPLGLG